MSDAARPDYENLIAVAVDEEGEIGDAVLGKLVFFQINDDDLRVTPESLEAYFEHYGIDSEYMPPTPEPRKVIKSLLGSMPRGKERHKTFHAADESHEHRYLIEFRPEEKQGGAIEAPLVRERRRDAAERKKTGKGEWDTTTVATVAWDPDFPDVIGFDIKERYADEYPYDEIIAQLEEEFADRCAHITGNALRGVMTKILNETMCVPARPKGGVWIIPRDAVNIVERLKEMITVLAAQRPELDGDDEDEDDPVELEFHMVPLVDASEARLFIRGKVEAKVVRELTGALHELEKLVSSGHNASPRELSVATRIRRDALALRDHYRYVVGNELERVSESLEVFERLYAAAQRAGEAEAPAA